MARKQSVPPSNRSKQLKNYYRNLALTEEQRQRKRDYDYKSRQRRAQGNMYSHILYSMRNTRHRALKKGLEFELDAEWLDAQPMQCAVTGTQFNFLTHGKGPLHPSFDRIDPKKGYTKQNTRLVCLWYNMAKGAWPDDEIRGLLRLVARHLEAQSNVTEAPPATLRPRRPSRAVRSRDS